MYSPLSIFSLSNCISFYFEDEPDSSLEDSIEYLKTDATKLCARTPSDHLQDQPTGKDENHNGGVKGTAKSSPVERPLPPVDGQPDMADDIKVKVYKADKGRRGVSWSEAGKKVEDKKKGKEDMVRIQLEDSGEIIDVEAKFLEQVSVN